MTHLSIALLGRFEVSLDEQPVDGFRSDKARLLLAYLATEADRAHRRDALAGLLWPGYTQASALVSLRSALANLRQILHDAQAQPPFLLITPETVQFNRGSDHTLDVALLQGVPPDCLDEVSRDRLRRAADAHRGDLLEGYALADCPALEEWLTQQREHLRQRAGEVLEQLCTRALADGDYRQAERDARRWLELDAWDERAHRQLMRALVLGGQRGAALAQYEACVRALAEGPGVGPDAEITALREGIRDGSVAAPLALPSAPSASTPVAPSASHPAEESVLPPLHQLPPSPPDFVGREEELHGLLGAVQAGARTIAVRGLGGMGKTSLALRLAEQLAERYPDAQLYIEMHGMDPQPLAPAEAMAHLIRSYHPQAQIPGTEAALGALYRSVLQGQRALILLDNVRDRAQVEPLLPPASCLLLITSRWRFALPGLHTLDLQAQPQDQAAQMLHTIAPRLSQEEAEGLTRACGGLPLALRVVGSALAEWEDLPVEEYLEKIHAVQGHLPEELIAVESSLALSDTLLNEALRTRWYALAIFPETFDRSGAQAVWGMEGVAEAQGTLSELLRYSLLEYDAQGKRYRLHDLCRAYAAARLGAQAAEEARARHAAHYAQVYREADRLYVVSGFDSAALKLYDREWPNILAGQAYAASRLADSRGRAPSRPSDAADEAASRYLAYVPPALGSALVLIRLLVIRLEARRRVAWWQAGLRAARQVQDRDAEMRCLLWLAMAHRELGQFLPMLGQVEQALAIAQQLGDRGGEAASLHQLSVARSVLDGPAKGLTYSERCLAIVRELEWRVVEALVLRFLAHQYLELEQPQRAMEHAQSAVLIARRITPAPPHMGLVMQVSGWAYTEAGDPRRGLEDLQSALASIRGWGSRLWEGITLTCMGRAYRALGEIDRAREHFERALAIGRETGGRATTAEALDELGQLHAAQGEIADMSRAVSYYDQALPIWNEVGSRFTRGARCGT